MLYDYLFRSPCLPYSATPLNGYQSKRGNAFLERIISLYLTWKQRGLNPFQNLLSIVS
ncbi:hypothetical protein [Wolbachia endosymbiont (group B) of Sphaerophoria taeniata]|uniref:hypothetical protein n=1 Tax=Wolbachia endosymbiont (group B) of Sphaerophoria taeniata TaxID=2954058 RepID=UPI0022201FE8|nr:hypothetical protein [Wolbachia endosymbiont (group B) of Sphaerophoria taeniata]